MYSHELRSNTIKIGKSFFTYTLLTFVLDYGKMNLLKTDEIFFIGLATTAAVKKKQKKTTKTKQSIIKNIMIRSNIINKKNKLQNNNISKQVCITPWHRLFWWLRSKLLLFKFTVLGK